MTSIAASRRSATSTRTGRRNERTGRVRVHVRRRREPADAHRPQPATATVAKSATVGYTYDTLHRVTHAGYTAPAGVSTDFDYDLLGNRDLVTDTLNGVTRAYFHDEGNQYYEVTADTVSQGYAYDLRGNLSRDDGFDGDPDDRFVYNYDVDNRLTKVSYDNDGTGDPAVIAEYLYDALGRRIEFIDSPPGGTTVTRGTTTTGRT